MKCNAFPKQHQLAITSTVHQQPKQLRNVGTDIILHLDKSFEFKDFFSLPPGTYSFFFFLINPKTLRLSIGGSAS